MGGGIVTVITVYINYDILKQFQKAPKARNMCVMVTTNANPFLVRAI